MILFKRFVSLVISMVRIN